jgi:hypothetical protein
VPYFSGPNCSWLLGTPCQRDLPGSLRMSGSCRGRASARLSEDRTALGKRHDSLVFCLRSLELHEALVFLVNVRFLPTDHRSSDSEFQVTPRLAALKSNNAHKITSIFRLLKLECLALCHATFPSTSACPPNLSPRSSSCFLPATANC